MLPLARIVSIMQINQYKIQWKVYTLCSHDVYVKNFNNNLRFMFQNINNVLFDRPLTLKCNCWMKRWNTNSLECDHEFLNNNMHKRISKFQNLNVIHNDDSLKTCDLWLHAIDLTKILNLWVIYNLKSRQDFENVFNYKMRKFYNFKKKN